MLHITGARGRAQATSSTDRIENGAFATGATIHGRITIPGYEHLTMEMQIERIEPERYFSYRWHPYPIDPQADYSAEPTTLVELRLDEARAEPW